MLERPSPEGATHPRAPRELQARAGPPGLRSGRDRLVRGASSGLRPGEEVGVTGGPLARPSRPGPWPSAARRLGVRSRRAARALPRALHPPTASVGRSLCPLTLPGAGHCSGPGCGVLGTRDQRRAGSGPSRWRAEDCRRAPRSGGTPPGLRSGRDRLVRGASSGLRPGEEVGGTGGPLARPSRPGPWPSAARRLGARSRRAARALPRALHPPTASVGRSLRPLTLLGAGHCSGPGCGVLGTRDQRRAGSEPSRWRRRAAAR